MKRTNLVGRRVRYAEEKFYLAYRALATGPGDVCSRLHGASLHFDTVRPEDLPPKLRRDFRWIVRRLTSREPRRIVKETVVDGSVKASLDQMQNRTGARIAERIVKIAEALEGMVYSSVLR